MKSPQLPKRKKAVAKRAKDKRAKIDPVESAAEEPTKAAAASPTPTWPDHISVRMYNNILGDCFLIRIPTKGDDFKILIDCGALQGMPAASNIINEIADDIARTTSSHLNVLAITHEHWDHLSGFAQAQNTFAGIAIDELWLAWTENDGDPEAKRIRDRRSKTLQLLLTLDRHFWPTENLHEDDETEEAVQPDGEKESELRKLLTFTGEAPLAAAPASPITTGTILKTLKARAKKVRYFTPGCDPLTLSADVPILTYVLGPPKDTKLLFRSNPRKGEVYLTQDDVLGGYLAAALRLDKKRDAFTPDEAKAFEMAMPFDKQHFRSLSAMSGHLRGYFLPRDDWRRIDRDWLTTAEQLALKLDSDTNNTSLVLAFAIGDAADHRVLLFPGDAQVGNWESWRQYVWPAGAKQDDPDAITAARLLAATVLYKVGHHASHNATLRDAGLELMTHPDLVALIPVREEFARTIKHWNMPFPALLSRLLEKTKGRVLRADRSLDDLKADAAKRSGGPGELSQSDWDGFFSRLAEGPASKFGDCPIYVEYAIPITGA